MGIGEAIASSLVEAGADVILISRSEVSPRPTVRYKLQGFRKVLTDA